VKEEPFDWTLEQVVTHHLAEDTTSENNQPAPATPSCSAHYHKEKSKVITFFGFKIAEWRIVYFKNLSEQNFW